MPRTADPTKFTVIIPTRERCDTLEYSLRTVTNQNYENLDIIVSDNCSEDETKEVVMAVRDRRIRYINTGKRVSMSANWEYALSHVNSGFVMYLGDDDGLLPDALDSLNNIIRETNCEAISWERATYCWPKCPKSGYENTLTVPLSCSLKKRHTEKVLKPFFDFKSGCSVLPQIYTTGLVHYNVIRSVVSNSTNKFFNSIAPDLYAAIALAFGLKTYYFSHRPFSIVGSSHNSNMNPWQLKNYINENDIKFHEKLIRIHSGEIYVAESMFQAKDHIPAARGYSVDLMRVIKRAAQSATYLDEDDYGKVIKGIWRIGKKNNIDDETLSKAILPRKRSRYSIGPVLGYNYFLKRIRVDSSEYGVKDVYGASTLCNEVLGSKYKYLGFTSPVISTLAYLKREYKIRSTR